MSNAWTPESATAADYGSVYFTIENTNAIVEKLFSASVAQSFAKSASIQEPAVSAGSDANGSPMKDINSVTIPPNGIVVFEQAGDRVMLTGLASPLKNGQKFDLNLGFMNAGIIKVTVTVKAS